MQSTECRVDGNEQRKAAAMSKPIAMADLLMQRFRELGETWATASWAIRTVNNCLEEGRTIDAAHVSHEALPLATQSIVFLSETATMATAELLRLRAINGDLRGEITMLKTLEPPRRQERQEVGVSNGMMMRAADVEELRKADKETIARLTKANYDLARQMTQLAEDIRAQGPRTRRGEKG